MDNMFDPHSNTMDPLPASKTDNASTSEGVAAHSTFTQDSSNPPASSYFPAWPIVGSYYDTSTAQAKMSLPPLRQRDLSEPRDKAHIPSFACRSPCKKGSHTQREIIDDWEVLGQECLPGKNSDGVDDDRLLAPDNTPSSTVCNNGLEDTSPGPTDTTAAYWWFLSQPPAVKTENIQQPSTSSFFLNPPQPKAEIDGNNFFQALENLAQYLQSGIAKTQRVVDLLMEENMEFRARLAKIEAMVQAETDSRQRLSGLEAKVDGLMQLHGSEIDKLRGLTSITASKEEVNALAAKSSETQQAQAESVKANELEDRMAKAEAQIDELVANYLADALANLHTVGDAADTSEQKDKTAEEEVADLIRVTNQHVDVLRDYVAEAVDESIEELRDYLDEAIEMKFEEMRYDMDEMIDEMMEDIAALRTSCDILEEALGKSEQPAPYCD